METIDKTKELYIVNIHGDAKFYYHRASDSWYQNKVIATNYAEMGSHGGIQAQSTLQILHRNYPGIDFRLEEN